MIIFKSIVRFNLSPDSWSIAKSGKAVDFDSMIGGSNPPTPILVFASGDKVPKFY